MAVTKLGDRIASERVSDSKYNGANGSKADLEMWCNIGLILGKIFLHGFLGDRIESSGLIEFGQKQLNFLVEDGKPVVLPLPL